MKRLLVICALALSLGGCAAIQKLEDVYSTVSGSTISPQQVYIAANAFDAVKVTATNYFTYCRTHLSTAPCSADNRRVVLKWIRSGTAARNQAETYLDASIPAPVQIYQTLVAAVTALKQSALASGAVR